MNMTNQPNADLKAHPASSSATCSTAGEIERLAIPLWAIAAGVNTGNTATICWGIVAMLACFRAMKTMMGKP